MALTDLTRISTSGIATGTSLSGAILHGDAHFRGTQVGVTSALFDSSDNALEFNDNVKLKFGNSGDLELYHDTSNGSYIKEAGPGALRIQGDAGIWIQSTGNQDRITATNDAVNLFSGGTKRFETTNTGAIVTGILTATNGLDAIGIQSGGVNISTGILTAINFIGLGNTFAVNGTTVDVSISGNSGAGGTWSSYTAGIATTKSVGINTNNFDDPDVVGAGNSFQGLYISNGMMITDNSLHGNHYIGTAFNGLMAGPVTIHGTLTVDGNYVVV